MTVADLTQPDQVTAAGLPALIQGVHHGREGTGLRGETELGQAVVDRLDQGASRPLDNLRSDQEVPDLHDQDRLATRQTYRLVAFSPVSCSQGKRQSKTDPDTERAVCQR